MNSIKKCRICSEIASGFNYERLSCESCKVFFCRNFSRIETLKCKNVGNCEITISTRKKCAKCRLMKCLSVGMKKIEGNKCIPPINNTSINKAELVLEMSIRRCISEDDNKPIIDLFANQLDTQQIPKKKRHPIVLSQYELNCIDKVKNAIKVFHDERLAQVIQTLTNPQELVNLPLMHNKLYYKKFINFCQHFDAFNSATDEDQLILFKSSFLQFMEIRITFQYDTDKKGILIFSDESESEVFFIGKKLDTAYKNKTIVRNMTKFSNCFYKAMNNDVNIRDLLSAIVLFKTQRNLSCHENIRYHYYLYSTILRRYLLCKYQNKKQANRKYLSLTRQLDLLDIHINQHRKMQALELGVNNLSSFVRELFELH